MAKRIQCPSSPVPLFTIVEIIDDEQQFTGIYDHVINKFFSN